MANSTGAVVECVKWIAVRAYMGAHFTFDASEKLNPSWDEPSTRIGDRLTMAFTSRPGIFAGEPEAPLEFPDVIDDHWHYWEEDGTKKIGHVRHRACYFVTAAGNIGAVVRYDENPEMAAVRSFSPGIFANDEEGITHYSKLRNLILERGLATSFITPERCSLVDRWANYRAEFYAKQKEGGKTWTERAKAPHSPCKPPELTHPVTNEVIVMAPNDPANIAFAQLLYQSDRWETNVNEGYRAAQDTKSGTVLIWEPENPDGNEIAALALESSFAAVKHELLIDLRDILFWHWLSNGRPKPHASITLGQILEYRHVVARDNTVNEHWQAMRDLRSFRMRGQGIESEALFHISAAGDSDRGSVKTIYRYHPGFFLTEALQTDKFFVAYCTRRIWELDYYRDANAKRLARSLRTEWRRNLQSYKPGGTPRHRTWGAILEDCGISTTTGRAVTHPRKFIASIEAEADKLYGAELTAFSTGDWAKIYHPEDVEKRAELPRTAPLAAWQKLRTFMPPFEDIANASAEQTQRRIAELARRKALAAQSEPRERARRRRTG